MHWAGWYLYDEQIYGGEMEEKEKHTGSCSVERSRTEEVKEGETD